MTACIDIHFPYWEKENKINKKNNQETVWNMICKVLVPYLTLSISSSRTAQKPLVITVQYIALSVDVIIILTYIILVDCFS